MFSHFLHRDLGREREAADSEGHITSLCCRLDPCQSVALAISASSLQLLFVKGDS